MVDRTKTAVSPPGRSRSATYRASPERMGGSSRRRTGWPRMDVPFTGREAIAEGYRQRMPKSADGAARDRVAISNRRARHEYFIIDVYECGLVLVGSEVKSIRDGRANLPDAYARIDHGEVWLYGMHVSPYPSPATTPTRPQAQAPAPPVRDRPPRRQTDRGRAHPRPPRSTSRTARPRSSWPSPGASASGTSARPWPSATPSGRPSGGAASQSRPRLSTGTMEGSAGNATRGCLVSILRIKAGEASRGTPGSSLKIREKK